MRYVWTFGALAGAIAITIISATIALDLSNHTSSVWFGYLVMLAALSLIFVGVKRYRDSECGGVIRFGRAFGLGLAMATVAAVAYALGWELFTGVTGYDFMADYSAGVLDGMRAEGATPAAIAAQAAELEALGRQLQNPLFRVPMIFVEIFPVGVLVALVSAALLRNPRFLPAAA